MSCNYPIKFVPILQERIWGGNKLNKLLGKEDKNMPIGESWEISTVPNNVSVVANGSLKGKDLQELIATYKAEFVGVEVFEKFGTDFPLLIKFIDAKSDLSVQLHPDDTLAKERHNSLGKEEMWYIMQAEKESRLLFGFNQKLSKDNYLSHLNNNTLSKVLHQEKIDEGDVYHIPTGRVHAIGAGVVLAEIQQSSDITYRLYDWDRKDAKGKGRELHTDLALDAIDFDVLAKFKTKYTTKLNVVSTVVKSPNFKTDILILDQLKSCQIAHKNSFAIYMCVGGAGSFITNDFVESIKMGETIFIPASLQEYQITPNQGNLKLLKITA